MAAAPRIDVGTAIIGKDLIAEARAFINEHEKTIKPLEKDMALKWWDANITGSDEDFKAKADAQIKLDLLLSDREKFAVLSKLIDSLHHRATSPGNKADAVVVRQIEVLHLQYLEKQLDPQMLKDMTEKANQVEQAFNVFRAKVDGKELADSDVRKVLKESKSSAERKAVWEASKAVGSVVKKDLVDLVKMRNNAAQKLGFSNYHVMQLHLSEQSQSQVLKLFDELFTLTHEPFKKVKAQMDKYLADTYKIEVADLRPWHYHDPFFQEPPHTSEVSFDPVYAQQDILQLCQTFYKGIGLPIDDVIKRSDLYEKKGKSAHAFCTDIDKAGDVRVLANIVPNEYWASTMLHELGHSVYSSKNIPDSVPYVLRGESHILTTEGIAMMFEKFSKNVNWLLKMGVDLTPKGSSDKTTLISQLTETGQAAIKNQLLIFAAWCQVMFRFEVGMYGDPDQDLNKLWWDLVEKYQLLTRPESRDLPDYASKIHVVVAPAYYHNYLMGEIFATQLHATISREVLKTEPEKALYNDNKEVGAFLIRKVFAPAKTLSWDVLTRYATGEYLNPKAFSRACGMIADKQDDLIHV